MLCIVYGTFFSTAVIVAENILRFQFIGIDQPTQQPDQGIVGLLSELSVVRLIAAFDRDGILVTGLHRVSDLIQRNTLDDLPVIADDEMRAGTALMIVLKLFEITAVLCRTADSPWILVPMVFSVPFPTCCAISIASIGVLASAVLAGTFKSFVNATIPTRIPAQSKVIRIYLRILARLRRRCLSALVRRCLVRVL